MQADLRSILRRARPTLIEDTLGAAALVIMLLVGLNIPGLI